MLKKYHLADLLSLSRIPCSLAVIVCLLLEPSVVLTRIVLVVFGLGEITDALDGIFANLFPYPDDGKHRFWRTGNWPKTIDTGTDLLLGASTLFYVVFRVLRMGIQNGLILIFCLILCLLIINRLIVVIRQSNEHLGERLVKVRRVIYAAAGVGSLVILLTIDAGWMKALWSVYVVLLIVLVVAKLPRVLTKNGRRNLYNFYAKVFKNSEKLHNYFVSKIESP